MFGGILTEGVLQAIVILGLLATVAEGLTEYLVAPLWDRYKIDSFWLRYWAWGFSLLLSLAAGVNVFAEVIPIEWAGVALTAVIAARGSNWIHDVFSRVARPEPEPEPVLFAPESEGMG